MNIAPLQQGSAINNRFEIQEDIGQGSFGITYRAWDRLLKRQIALKECFPASICQREGKRVKPADKEQYEKVRMRILHEARTLASVKHPGVVAVHSIFIDEETDSLFIEMDWLAGPTLEKKMKQGSVSHKHAFEWLHMILCALKQVHKKNITHCDIKPANIVFDGNGVPVLIDFGAALNRELKEGTTMAGPYTPRYAAPEQLYSIGPWTDLYSLAVTWCELLTGKCNAGDELKLLSERYPEYQALFLSVKKNLEAKNRCQNADEWLDMLRRPVAPTIPEVTVNEIRECIKAVRGCYPKDENVEMPLPLELLVRLAECAHLELNPYEKLRCLQQIHAFVYGKSNMGIGDIGNALSWDKQMTDEVESFFLLPAEPIEVHGASLATLNLARKYFWKSWGIMQTLCGISSMVRKLNPGGWRKNVIFAKYGQYEKNEDDVRWLLSEIRSRFPASGGFPMEIELLSHAVDVAFAGDAQARRNMLEQKVAGIGKDEAARSICLLLNGNLDKFDEVRSKLSDLDWVGQVTMNWLGLPQWYFVQSGNPTVEHIEQILEKIPVLMREINPVFWAENKRWLYQNATKK